MRSLSAFLFSVTIVGLVLGDPVADIQTKISGYVNFFTSSQWNTLTNALLSQVIVNASPSDIESAMIDDVWNSLSGSQYAQGIQLYSDASNQYGGEAAVNKTIQQCINGTGPLLIKLYKKMWTKKIQPQASASNSTKMQAAANFINKKFTTQMATTVVGKCKNQLTATDWSKGKSILGNVVNFSKLGL